MSSVMPSDATTPPKRLVRPAIASSGSATARASEQALDTAAQIKRNQKQARTEEQAGIFCDARESFFQQKKGRGSDQRAKRGAEPAEHDIDHQVARARPEHHRRADKVGVIGEQCAGQPAQGAGNNETDQAVAKDRKADRPHPPLVGARAADDQAKARIDEARTQENAADKDREAQIIEQRAVVEIEQAGELAALADGHTVVA